MANDARLRALLGRQPHALLPTTSSGGSSSDHASVVIVFPVHKPKFHWACQFLLSALRAAHDAPHVLPVFSDEASAASFNATYGDLGVLARSGFLVMPDDIPRDTLQDAPNGVTDAPVTIKKALAVWHIFDSTPASHVLAVDAESELQPGVRAGDAARYAAAWEAQRAMISGPQSKQVSNRMCAVLGLPKIEPNGHEKDVWWADAPFYSRHDYGAFLAAVNWSRPLTQYDHALYLCHKYHTQRWQVRRITVSPQTLTCAEQERLQPRHAFAWARDVCRGRRLLRYHLDMTLNLKAHIPMDPASVCLQKNRPQSQSS